MPRGLWRRVEQRFAPARVLEFYASTEATAILVNLRDVKRGSMGRRLPGSAEVRIAAYDIDARELELASDGLARECAVDEVGLLLARVSLNEALSTTPLRGVFARDDAWLATGDLFRRDADGDFWRVDGLGEVVHTAEGPAFTAPIRDALYDVPAVDLVVAYGVQPGGGEAEIAVAAVTLRPGRELTAREIFSAVAGLPAHGRPAIVHVVDQIPVTTWFRPITGPLRDAGVPQPSGESGAWYLDASGRSYRPLTVTARRRLTGRAA
jgi:putative long chain acyl-CoA synthase